MYSGGIENGTDVRIAQTVKNVLPRAAIRDEIVTAKRLKLMGNGRLGNAEKIRKIANTKLRGGKRKENAKARRIPEKLKALGKAAKLPLLGNYRKSRADMLGMQLALVTNGGLLVHGALLSVKQLNNHSTVIIIRLRLGFVKRKK